jgi:hypothetical protein
MKRLYTYVSDSVSSYVSSTSKLIRDTHPLAQGAAFSVACLVLALLSAPVLFGPSQKRSIFYFPAHASKAVRTEIRYLPVKKTQAERLSFYIDELLLGPISPDLAPVYPTDTRVSRLFIRGDELYVDITASALEYWVNSVEPDRSFAIFKKNVCTNFRNVDKIYLYIDGKEAYGMDSKPTLAPEKKKR